MKFMTPYRSTRERSNSFATINREPSMTQQTDKDETNINVIVGRFLKTGQLPTIQASAIQGDFTNALDFRQANEQLRKATESFEALPAHIQKRFAYDPAEFIDFTSKEENLPELRKLGLANEPAPPPKEPAPIKVIVTNPDPAT